VLVLSFSGLPFLPVSSRSSLLSIWFRRMLHYLRHAGARDLLLDFSRSCLKSRDPPRLSCPLFLQGRPKVFFDIPLKEVSLIVGSTYVFLFFVARPPNSFSASKFVLSTPFFNAFSPVFFLVAAFFCLSSFSPRGGSPLEISRPFILFSFRARPGDLNFFLSHRRCPPRGLVREDGS